MERENPEIHPDGAVVVDLETPEGQAGSRQGGVEEENSIKKYFKEKRSIPSDSVGIISFASCQQEASRTFRDLIQQEGFDFDEEQEREDEEEENSEENKVTRNNTKQLNMYKYVKEKMQAPPILLGHSNRPVLKVSQNQAAVSFGKPKANIEKSLAKAPVKKAFKTAAGPGFRGVTEAQSQKVQGSEFAEEKKSGSQKTFKKISQTDISNYIKKID